MVFPLVLAAAVWQTWPFNGVRTLPGTVRPANAREEVTVVTARGAPAVFAAAIRSDRAATDVKPSAGTVKTESGATFDAGAATVRWVKCEACDPNVWFTGEPGIGEKTLIPVRLVSGAAEIAKDETREFVFRLEVPKDAKPGLYRGKLTFASAAGELGSAPLALRIIPYVLGPAVTRTSDRVSLDGSKVFPGGEPALLSTEPTPYEILAKAPADWTTDGPGVYEREAGTAKAVVTVGDRYPDKHEVRRWHAIGVRNYLKVGVPPALANPWVWRRDAGVKAYLLGFDGAIASAGADTLVGAALEEAMTDVRYLSAVSQLAHRLRYSDEYKLRLEGRMGTFFVDSGDQTDAYAPDADNLRLEAIATLDRFDALLAGAKEGK